jgi:hypothetical protein
MLVFSHFFLIPLTFVHSCCYVTPQACLVSWRKTEDLANMEGAKTQPSRAASGLAEVADPCVEPVEVSGLLHTLNMAVMRCNSAVKILQG